MIFIEYLKNNGVDINFSNKDIKKIKQIANFCCNLETYLSKELSADGLITTKSFDNIMKTHAELITKEAFDAGLIDSKNPNNKNIGDTIFNKIVKDMNAQYNILKNIEIKGKNVVNQ